MVVFFFGCLKSYPRGQFIRMFIVIGCPAPQQESKSNEVRVSLFVDEDRALWAFPQREIARKPCTSACECPPVSSLTFGKVFPAADVTSKSRQPRSCGRCPSNLGD